MEKLKHKTQDLANLGKNFAKNMSKMRDKLREMAKNAIYECKKKNIFQLQLALGQAAENRSKKHALFNPK